MNLTTTTDIYRCDLDTFYRRNLGMTFENVEFMERGSSAYVFCYAFRYGLMIYSVEFRRENEMRMLVDIVRQMIDPKYGRRPTASPRPWDGEFDARKWQQEYPNAPVPISKPPDTRMWDDPPLQYDPRSMKFLGPEGVTVDDFDVKAAVTNIKKQRQAKLTLVDHSERPISFED